jgi:putative heme-binding domain-containing protein
MEIYDFALKNLAQKPTEGRALFFANLGALIGLSQDEQIIKKLLQNLQKQTKSENYWTSTATLEGLSKTLAMSEKPLNNALADEKKSLMSLLFVDKNGQLGKAVLGLLDIIGLPDENSLAPYLQKSLTILKDSTTEVASRCEALSFLAAYDAKKYLPDIQPFTQAQQPIELQKTAILAFRKVKGLEACAYLIKQWDNFSPEIRLEAVEVFMQDKPRKLLLLSALEKKQIPPTAIQWPNQVRLMNTDEMDIRDRSRVIFATQTTDKAAILSKYKSVATLQGDAHKGQALYQSLCAVCHQVGGKAGKNIGPDLATLGNRDDLSIALEIALPSNSLADGYEYWTIEKTDGQKTFGLISSETANALTVKDLSGKESTIARIQIKRLTASNTSIMPAGFDKSLNPQQMADLIKFIRE